jgi:hypothetical protein
MNMAGRRDSGDSAVYRKPLPGGEAIDEDVEGHSLSFHSSAARMAPKAAGKMTLHAAGKGARATDDDDVEGHTMKLAANAGPKLRAARGARATGDDDVEGHAMKSAPRVAKGGLRAGDDEDVEGHSRTVGPALKAARLGPAPKAAKGMRASGDDDDVEGHSRTTGPAPKARARNDLVSGARQRASDDSDVQGHGRTTGPAPKARRSDEIGASNARGRARVTDGGDDTEGHIGAKKK